MLKDVIILLPELSKASFVERLNRFVGLVDVAGQVCPAHVSSSGRMRELLFPGNIVYVSPLPAGKRTQYRIHLAHHGETLVSVDSLLPNRLVHKSLLQQALAQFRGYREIKKEACYGESRFDLYLEDGARRCFIEVKSVTLVEDDGVARFPDAPSKRGKKHLQELIRTLHDGFRAAVIFVVQRNDARVFSPNLVTDPLFAEALRLAASAGVEIYALGCSVSRQGIGLQNYLPVEL
ncbi:MAG: DNA/RNA nuclease SfsA [Pelotomaculaceae bacterium]|nr:DNA/RNA nuclease SfsA [Bacillota bacterium]HHU85993.1 DNA/RNA nuclease SfsA [Peptococcaceae bacterium]